MPTPPHPHFSGWRVCSFAALTQAIAIGFTLGAVGLFHAPMTEEFGMTATQFGLGVSGFSLAMNLSMPVIGRFLDTGSIRVVMALGAGLLGLSLGLLSIATELWQIGVLFAVGCSLGMAMLGPMASSTAMANWFDRLRGRALGIANAGAPAGPFVIVPIAGYFVVEVGWRPTVQGFALIALIVAIPAALYGIIDRASDVGQEPDGGLSEEPDDREQPRAPEIVGWEAAGIIRSRDFWLVALAAAPFGAQGIVLGANAIPFLLENGASPQAAAIAPIPLSLGAILGPLIFGSLADRIHPKRLFIGLCALICLAFAGLMTAPPYALALVLLSICGLVGGSMMPVYGALIGRLFGVGAFGQVMGLGALVGLPAVTAAPLLFGLAFDRSGGYALGLGGLIASLVFAMALFALLPKGEARRSQPVLA